MSTTAEPQVSTEAIHNGQADGAFGRFFIQNEGNIQRMRPFYLPEEPDRAFVTVRNRSTGQWENREIRNQDALLTIDQWRLLERTVRDAKRFPRQAWDELRAASTFNVPNAMGVLKLTHQRGNDPGEATASLNGEVKDIEFREGYDSVDYPLPIISCGFSVGARELAASQNGGAQALDTRQLEKATARVYEYIDDLTIGARTFVCGYGSVQGYRNFTARSTMTIANPASSWVPSDTVNNVIAMREALMTMKRSGPYVLYVGRGWDLYLDQDYKSGYPKTVRQRIAEIDGIQRVTTLRRLAGLDMVMVNLGAQNDCRALVGIEPTPIQWKDPRTGRVSLRVMTICAPQMFSDMDGTSGIVHGTV